jgi:predicted ATPase
MEQDKHRVRLGCKGVSRMLKRAHITGYKSLVDAEITFADPLTLIVGPNASGKTNLFDALALLSQMIAGGSVNEPFKTGTHRGSALAAFSIDESGIAGSMAHPEREMTLEVDVEVSPSDIDIMMDELHILDPNAKTENSPPSIFPWLRYSLHIQTRNQGRQLAIAQESLIALEEDGSIREPLTLFIDRQKGIPAFMYPRDKPQAMYSSPPEYDTDIPLASLPAYRAALAHTRVFRNEVARWRFYALDAHLMKQMGTYGQTPVLSSNGKDIAAYFDTLNAQQPRQFQQMRRQLSMIVPQIETFEVTPNNKAQVELTVREKGGTFSAEIISEGTLRVMGLLALSHPLEPVTLIGVEEPETGIHPHRLAYIAAHFRDLAEFRGKQTQYLLTSHSPLMPEYFAPEQVVVCQRFRNQTQFVPLREAGLFPLPQDEPFDPDADEPTPLRDRFVRGDYGG